MAILEPKSEFLSSIRIVDLLQASAKDLKEFSERVGKDGTIDVLVHPFFREDEPITERGPTSEYLYDANVFIKKRLNSDTRALVIFEEYNKLSKLELKMGNSEGTLYVIQTRAATHHPVIESDDKVGWSRINKLFQSLGIKHVTVGGRYLYYLPYLAALPRAPCRKV